MSSTALKSSLHLAGRKRRGRKLAQEPQIPKQVAVVKASCNCRGQAEASEGLTHRRPPRSALQPVQVDFTTLETPSLPAREMRELELKEYKRQMQVGSWSCNSLEMLAQLVVKDE